MAGYAPLILELDLHADAIDGRTFRKRARAARLQTGSNSPQQSKQCEQGP